MVVGCAIGRNGARGRSPDHQPEACVSVNGSTRDRFLLRLRVMIRKLAAGGYRLYSRKKDPKTGRRKNLGTFATRKAAVKHEQEVQYFKRH